MGIINVVGGSEIILVLVVILVLFGSKSLPEFARAFGKGMNEVRKATDEIKREIQNESKGLTDDVKDMKKNLDTNP